MSPSPRSNPSAKMATKPLRPINAPVHPSQSIWAQSILLFLLIQTTARCAEAQGPPPSTGVPFLTKPFNPSTAFIITVLIIGFFFVGFLSIYLRRCVRPTAAVDSPPGPLPGIKLGLDPSTLASFPTMPYSEAREHKLGLGALECAVCLLEFEDDETLKLLPRCCHVYHSDCIDAWLASHVTCPVCRANLATAGTHPPADHVAIDVSNDRKAEVAELARIGSRKRELRSRSVRAPQISRSRSAGYLATGLDRFTLRLPAPVKEEIFDEATSSCELRRAASCAVGRSGRWIPRALSVRRARNETDLPALDQV
ncbi:hypothetical protein J5N97_009625 [Dioscorea zingiberensis]|uniref:RING-type E3 ubiquitin transferase n=1 Tax=Dioscorea zingiberensis TaxID=325984 RepID=A0A9D5CZU2_9LILI|nr:hypothetical protein J5N97_009625 [Dioscorea zingiberensis]